MITVIQIFNSSIQKHGSFEDFMIELAGQAHERNVNLGFIFPGIKTTEIRNALVSLNAKFFIIKKRWSSFGFVGEILKIMQAENADVLDFHFCASLNLIPLFIILRLLKKKIIFHYHGEIMPVEKIKFINKYISRLRIFCSLADKIICVSEANRKFLQALNIRKKIDVVYNGIKIDNFRNVQVKSDFRKEYGINGELVVTSIGSLIPRKGMDIFLRAAKEILNNIPNVRFVIVGGGDIKKYEQLARDLGIFDKVILTGLLKDYPYHILKATDLYVSASFAESFGLSVAEAQIIGIAVVATEVGGIPEVVQDGRTGLLVEPGDYRKLALAIERLLLDENLRKKFSLAGQQWVSKQFELKNKVEEFINVCLD